MIKISKKDIEDARKLIATGNPEAVGYRLMIKPIEAVDGLEEVELEKYEALAAAGLITKSDEKRVRESKGTHHGILVDIGDYAYRTEQLGGKPWVQVGNVVIFDRYAGVEIELPPGSGEMYRFTNDESILGRMGKPV